MRSATQGHDSERRFASGRKTTGAVDERAVFGQGGRFVAHSCQRGPGSRGALRVVGFFQAAGEIQTVARDDVRGVDADDLGKVLLGLVEVAGLQIGVRQ